MYILGLSSPFSCNTGAALIKDGQLIAMAEEERFIRIKHAPNALPINSLFFCLEKAKIKMKDIDMVAMGTMSLLNGYTKSFIEVLLNHDLKRFLKDNYMFGGYFAHMVLLDRNLKKLGFDLFKNIRYVPHHVCHAVSAFYPSPFDEALVVTLDGRGENDSAFVGVGRGYELKRIKKVSSYNSLGLLYGQVTEMLGYRKHSEEGKIMALSAFGNSRKDIEDIFGHIQNGKYYINKDYEQKIGKIIKNKNYSLMKEGLLIASSLQSFVEKAAVELITASYEETKIGRLCLAGGVTLNCKMNQKLLNLPFIKDIFIQPAAYDSGTALGAALWVYSQKTQKRPPFKMENACWGPEYTRKEILESIKSAKVNFSKLKNPGRTAAKLLKEGKFIGWFYGRSEIGPRALGARSILAHPGLNTTKDKLNKEIKHREPYRPFALSILEEKAEEYFENYYPSPFMTLTFNVKKNKIKNIKAAVHVDNTVRVQSVSKRTNPVFWSLIKEFENLTGIPALLNTSFNDREPIVESPRDAIRTFFSTGLDVLILEDFILEK
ncbi:MAG: carbamoyltransferase C-terminal domain-containing protein [Candidatus Levybacteria bacterium]|nr:carbamoyltransferase C-terminal domain-containing protein [Candidatus Levybacteria bacterium]